jgi:hypothetical protein
MINKKTFTNADLNGSYQLIYTHNLNTQDLIPMLFDNYSIQAITADNFALGDENGNNKDNKVTLSLNNPITGTWKLLLSYQGASETSTGRRAFELLENNSPSDDNRVLLGKAATPSFNITLANLYALLLAKLGFLKKAENLNDLLDKSQARTNLGVYSISDVDAAVNGKATLYQAASGAVLGVSNTAIYTPTLPYHPSTKNYSDSVLPDQLFLTRAIFGAFNAAGTTIDIWKGTLTASVSHLGTGWYRITHNIGHYNYIVLGVGTTHSPFASVRTNENKAPTTVDIVVSDDASANDSDINFTILIWD